jgi:hypothetical protein
MNTSMAQRRRDLHNTSINIAAALAGQCGFTHVASGRVCHLPQGHTGPCDLRYLTARTPDTHRAAARLMSQRPTPMRSSHDR